MYYDTENFKQISIYIWHFASKWYALDLHEVTLDIQSLVLCCHQAFYPGVNRNLYEVSVARI
jgi:hypothetical protein